MLLGVSYNILSCELGEAMTPSASSPKKKNTFFKMMTGNR